MANNVKISLVSKPETVVTLKISDEVKKIVQSDTVTPIVTFITTGEKGDKGIDGTANVNDNAITATQIADGTITSAQIANSTIATADIGSQQVTTAKLSNNVITTQKVTDNAITGQKIANNSISARHIVDGTIVKELITDLSLTGAKIQNNSIDVNKLVDNTITAGKIANKTLTGGQLTDNIVLGGQTTVTSIYIQGSSPGYINGPSADSLILRSTEDLILQLDYDQSNQANNSTYRFRNGTGNDLLTLDENGYLNLAGNLNLTGDITLGGTVDGQDIQSALTITQNRVAKLAYITVTQSVNLDTMESNIATNNSKVTFPGLGTSSSTALAGNTALLQLGTSSSTALAGNTALLALGTSSSTALAGNTTTITTGQASAISANTSKSTNVTTNLGVTTSETTVIVTSSDGNNATVPVATTSVGGVMSKAIFDQHTANVAKNTNVVTNLAITGSAAARTITSSDGTDAVIPLGTTSVSGLLSPALFDEIDANTAKVSNVAGNLTVTAVATKLQLNTSNGSNISIPAATNTAWGAMSDDLVIALEANSAKATNVVTNLSVANSTGARVIASSDGTDATIPIATASVSGVMSKAIFDEHVLNNAKNTNVVQTTISGNAATATALTTGDKDITGDLSLTGSTDKLVINSTEIAKVVSNVINIGQANRVLKLNSSETQILSSTGIQLGHATDTTIARVSAGVVSIEGVNIQKENAHHHFIHAGFFLSFPFARYIPLNGSLNEQNTATLSPEYVNFTFPYDGFVKKMILRSETNMGSTNLKLYKGASGATVSTVLGNVTATVGASAAVLFDFSSVSNAYSKGDTMAIKVDPTADPDGGQNITIELVFDLTT